MLKYICAMNEEIHRKILIRLADLTRAAGLELLCTSSIYEKSQKEFSRTLRMLYSIYSFATEDLIARPRSETMPTGTRSRLDSTSNRLLRTLTTNGAQRQRNFKPPIEQIDESLNALWDALEHWFALIKDEIQRIPDSPVDSTLDGKLAVTATENRSVETKLLASELVRNKPKNITGDRRSITSLDSIRLSQPALEYNIAKASADLNNSLSRSIGKMLLGRQISSISRDSDTDGSQVNQDSVTPDISMTPDISDDNAQVFNFNSVDRPISDLDSGDQANHDAINTNEFATPDESDRQLRTPLSPVSEVPDTSSPVNSEISSAENSPEHAFSVSGEASRVSSNFAAYDSARSQDDALRSLSRERFPQRTISYANAINQDPVAYDNAAIMQGLMADLDGVDEDEGNVNSLSSCLLLSSQSPFS